MSPVSISVVFCFQAEGGIRGVAVTGVQTCALPIFNLISNPLHPKFVSQVSLQEPNMMRLTPDSRRLYVSNSLLSNLDGKVPFRVWLLNVGPQRMQLDDKFVVDFDRFPTGPARPHAMLLI